MGVERESLKIIKFLHKYSIISCLATSLIILATFFLGESYVAKIVEYENSLYPTDPEQYDKTTAIAILLSLSVAMIVL